MEKEEGGAEGPLMRADAAARLAAELCGADALGAAPPEDWTAEEVGDGNLNLVFRVRGGPARSLALKASPPFIRAVPTFALPASRVGFEHAYLEEAARRGCGARVPRVLGYDAPRHALALEWLEPHTVLRAGLCRGEEYPLAAAHLGTFLGDMLFRTSALALPPGELAQLRARFAGNGAMCEVTASAVFSDPFLDEPVFPNRWTTPALDADVAALRANDALRARVAELKHAFLTRGEALLHGDLHTGSVMVTAQDTRVFDAEFAFFGPIAFDVGMLLANLVVAAEARAPGDPLRARRWADVAAAWSAFAGRFLALWDSAEEARGHALTPPFLARRGGAESAARRRFLDALHADACGFAACEMIRRTVGIAHVADLDGIEDPAARTAAERRVLALAARMAVDPPPLAELAAAEAAPAGPATALVMLAKFPARGRAKTRLLRGGVENAHEFALASLLDLAEGLAGAAGRRVIAHAPPDDETARAFAAALEEGCGGAVARAWSLEPVAAPASSGGGSHIGAQLAGALRSARARGAAEVVFIGCDTPDLAPADVERALRDARRGFARLLPASDGGYVLLALPAGAPDSVFEGVEWSTPRTAVSQLARLGELGVPALVGATFGDVDEVEDLDALEQRLLSSDAVRAPRVRAFVEERRRTRGQQ